MATVTGIYWCLVLIGCVSLAVSASLVQTVPPNSAPVCPGGRLVFTCTASTNGLVLWIGDSGTGRTIASNGNPITVDSYNVTAALVNGVTVSYATNESVPIQLNGTNISCSDNVGLTYAVATVTIADIPEAVTNVTIGLINNKGLLITWNTPSDPCIDHYNVTINSNNTYNGSRTTNNTNITLDTLIIGTNYSFIIIPMDTIGREGLPSSLIQYIWNVPAQVVNISWDQISTDSITIWWNNTEEYEDIPPVVPPTQYYIISVYNTSNSIIYTNNTTNTVITITGLPLTDTNYTVSIIPVNVIGQGPSATVNVSITITVTSTSAVTSISSVTLTTDISTSTSVIYISSTSIIVTKTSSTDSLYTMSVHSSVTTTELTPTATFTSTQSTTTTATTTDSASGSNAVPIISGAIGTVLAIIIIIIIILIIILVYAKRHRIKGKKSHTSNGNETKGVTGSSYRNNNIELVPTDPTYAIPATEYIPAAASTVSVRTLQGGDGPPSYPPPPPTTGQYSVLRASDDDEVPPPVPAYNPNGVQEYSELRREGEKNKQQQQHGAGPVYSTLNQEDVPPPVPPAYNPEGVQEYSVLKREGENKGQQGLSPGATGLYSTINKDTNNQVVVVDESAHRPVYADLAIAAKGKRPAAAPTQEQPVLYASVNNKSVPPPIPPPAAPDKVLYADLSIAAGKRTPKNKPPTEERVVYAAVNGNRKSTTQELIMDRLGGLDIPPPIPPKPKP